MTTGSNDGIKEFTYLRTVVPQEALSRMQRLDREKPEQFSGRWINCGNPKSLEREL